jgi:hypothetical protein
VPLPLLIERLEVMGFTLVALKRDVKSWLKADVEVLDRQIEEYGQKHDRPMSSYFRDLKRRRRFLEKFTLERWVRTMRELRNRGILHRHDLGRLHRPYSS